MITKNVKLYLGDGFPVRVPVSQFDTMWQFVFTIVNNSQPWQIPTGATAVLNGKKPDGNVFAFSGTIENNTVTVDADVQMTAVAGQTVCELSILSDGKVVGTANFTLDVEAAPKSPDDISSESTLPAYQEMLDAMANIPYDIHGSVEDWLDAHPEATTTVQDGSITEQKLDPLLTAKVNGGGISNAVKVALLALLEKVAYIDEDGQTYLDALEDALYPPTNLVSISAVFNQGSAVIYDTDSLDTLKQYLTVTANYSDSTTETVTSYTLSGTLTVGTSTITVEYGDKTTTFTVTVTEYVPTANYVAVGNPTIVDNIVTVENGKYVRSTYALSPSAGDSWKIRMKFKYNTLSSGFANILGGSGTDAFAKTFVIQESANHQYIFYVSADETNWSVSNQFTGSMTFDTNTWYYLEFGYTGTKYYLEVKTGGWDGTRITNGYKEFTSTTVVYNGEYVGFGVTSAVSGFDGQIDLTECSIFVNGEVVWTALN